MISLNDVLLAMSNIPVGDPIAEIWGRGLQGGYKIIEYTDSLPITINANGDALLDYRIYGASGGVGEATEIGEPAGYKLPMTVSDGNTEQTIPVYIGENQLGEEEYVSYGEQKIYWRTNNVFSYAEPGNFSVGNVNVESDGKGKFTIKGTMQTGEETSKIVLSNDFTIPVSKGHGGQGVFCLLNDVNAGLKLAIVLYDANGIKIDAWSFNGRNRVADAYISMAGKTVHSIAFLCEQTITIDMTTCPMIMNDGTAPSTYIPYLQPTDPPVPLPEIPTIDGTTIIDYDGTPKPSQMYVKYKVEE